MLSAASFALIQFGLQQPEAFLGMARGTGGQGAAEGRGQALKRPKQADLNWSCHRKPWTMAPGRPFVHVSPWPVMP